LSRRFAVKSEAASVVKIGTFSENGARDLPPVHFQALADGVEARDEDKLGWK
jgi:hypothetical protein